MFFFQHFVAGIVVAMPLLAAAQGDTKRTDPLDASASAAAPGYRSAFADYRPFQEAGEAPDVIWRAANDEVARVGGHVGVLKEDAPQPGAAGKEDKAPSGMPPMQHKH